MAVHVQALDTAPEVRLSRANQIDVEARSIEKTNKRNFLRLGQLILECEAGEYWRELKHSSLEDWLCSAAPASRASGYEARRAILRLQEAKIAPEWAEDISRANINLLTTKVPPAARAEFLEPAKKLSEKELRQLIRENRPDLHVEEVEKVKLSFDRSQFEVVDYGMSLVRWLVDDPSLPREDCIEFAMNFLAESPCEKEGKKYKRKSNRVAFDDDKKVRK